MPTMKYDHVYSNFLFQIHSLSSITISSFVFSQPIESIFVVHMHMAVGLFPGLFIWKPTNDHRSIKNDSPSPNTTHWQYLFSKGQVLEINIQLFSKILASLSLGSSCKGTNSCDGSVTFKKTESHSTAPQFCCSYIILYICEISYDLMKSRLTQTVPFRSNHPAPYSQILIIYSLTTVYHKKKIVCRSIGSPKVYGY